MHRDMQACVARRFAKAWDEVGFCIRQRLVGKTHDNRWELLDKQKTIKETNFHKCTCYFSDQSRLDAFFAAHAIKTCTWNGGAHDHSTESSMVNKVLQIAIKSSSGPNKENSCKKVKLCC